MMADPAAPQPPPPKPPSGLWKWTKRIGCTFVLTMLAVVLTCCGITCGGSWWLKGTMRNKNKDDVDRIHAEGLHDGDLEAMHGGADTAFRQRYSLKDLQAFVQERPGLFERANFFGGTLKKRNVNGVEYVRIQSRPGWLESTQWELVFKKVDGVYVLVGISPGMDEVVPPILRWDAPRGGGGHLFWD